MGEQENIFVGAIYNYLRMLMINVAIHDGRILQQNRFRGRGAAQSKISSLQNLSYNPVGENLTIHDGKNGTNSALTLSRKPANFENIKSVK